MQQEISVSEALATGHMLDMKQNKFLCIYFNVTLFLVDFLNQHCYTWFLLKQEW